MAPDAAQLPRMQVTQPVVIGDLSRQTDALALQSLELTRIELTRSGDTVDSLLRRLGVFDASAAAFLRTDKQARRLLDGRAGKIVLAKTFSDGTLLELVARFAATDPSKQASHFSRLTVSADAGQWRASLEEAPLVFQTKLGSGTVQSSLWAATDEARLPEAIAGQLIDIFSADIDFHRQLRKGDTFSVTYEAVTADDQPITWGDGAGRVLAAEFVNGGKAFQLFWFGDANRGKGGYYRADGKSHRRSFLASPLRFSRVTSGFAMRLHPILQTWRAHNGVDYGAPTGTPVRSVGDGVVRSAGVQGGYGLVVQVQHGHGRSTLYGHLSRIDVKVGQRVEQGQHIGTVGATGWATGPHLHYEFQVNGQFQDPAKASGAGEVTALDPASKDRFDQVATAAASQLQLAATITGFRGNAE